MCAQWLSDGSDDDAPPPPYKFVPSAEIVPKPKNVILSGETGTGKSSVINLIAGAEIALTSGDTKACTLLATKYSMTLTAGSLDPEMTLSIWDTIGLEEPDEDLFKAIENAHRLVTDMNIAGGVDLFCIRAGRITMATQRNYRLSSEVLRAKHVPLAIVVTHLENEGVMEEWWVRNQQVSAMYGICSIAHACIMAAPVHLETYAAKRAASQAVLKGMLRRTLSEPRPAYMQDVESWFVSVIESFWAFLTSGVVGSLEKKTLVKKPETKCAYSREDA